MSNDLGGRNDTTERAHKTTSLLIHADEHLLSALKSQVSRWRPELVFGLVQTLAILAGGAWAYFLYVTFQAESNRLAIEAAKLAERQAQLSLKRTDLELRQGAISFEKLSQSPLAVSGKLTVSPVSGSGDKYLVSYDYTWTNNGSKRITVSPVMVEAFFADTGRLALKRALAVNDVGDPGELIWECISRRGFVIAKDWRSDVKVINGSDRADSERGGGGSGELNGGETIGGNITSLIRGRPSDFVGVRIRYSIGDGKQQVDRRRLRDFTTLGRAGGKL